MDLIERKRRGLGRPSLIYVKDFSSGLPKAQVQNCPNSNSGAAESAILEQLKPQASNTDKNKTEWNDPDPIYSGGIREQLEDYFYQSLEVDLLLRLCPDDEDTIYQIVDLLVDTCSTKRKMLRIAGDDKPTEVVRSRLKKLNADHIRFVLDSQPHCLLRHQAAGQAAQKAGNAHRAGCRVGARDRQPQCRKIYPVLCRRIPPFAERRADCGLFCGDLEAFPQVGRHPDSPNAERQRSAGKSRSIEYF